MSPFILPSRSPAGAAPSSAIHKYLWGSYVDEPLMLVSVTGSGPTATETKHYYHTNRLYCVAGLTDANGNVVERYAYTPYGKQTILSPSGAVMANSAIYQT